jgi:hypothetical protein
MCFIFRELYVIFVIFTTVFIRNIDQYLLKLFFIY